MKKFICKRKAILWASLSYGCQGNCFTWWSICPVCLYRFVPNSQRRGQCGVGGGSPWKTLGKKRKSWTSVKENLDNLFLFPLKLKKIKKWMTLFDYFANWIEWDLYFDSKMAEPGKAPRILLLCHESKGTAHPLASQALPNIFFPLWIVFQLRNMQKWNELVVFKDSRQYRVLNSIHRPWIIDCFTQPRNWNPRETGCLLILWN